MTDRPYRMRVGAVVSVSNAEPRKLRYPAFVGMEGVVESVDLTRRMPPIAVRFAGYTDPVRFFRDEVSVVGVAHV